MTPVPSSALRTTLALLAAASGELRAQEPAPPASLRLDDVSLTVLGSVGASTARDAELADLEGGAHDPRQRGFTLQQVELAIAAAVDPWFRATTFVAVSIDPEGETIVELEEAFLSTTGLPAGLQLDAGAFFTEFGLVNGTHPHEWTWLNQPVILTRVFGGDGMRGPGARFVWHAPFARHSDLIAGAQNASGETMASFFASEEFYGERGIGGRAWADPEVRSLDDVVWTLRAATRVDAGGHAELGFGASVACGPNPTGGDAGTVIWGADGRLRWHAHGETGEEWPLLEVQAEYIARVFEASAQVDTADPQNPIALPAATLHDQGGYVHAHWSFAPQWSVGVRAELATGSGASYRGGGVFARELDPYRADRLRVSPLLSFAPSEHARFRLQYDYDDSDHLGEDVHSLWLGFEVQLGAHRAHRH